MTDTIWRLIRRALANVWFERTSIDKARLSLAFLFALSLPFVAWLMLPRFFRKTDQDVSLQLSAWRDLTQVRRGEEPSFEQFSLYFPSSPRVTISPTGCSVQEHMAAFVLHLRPNTAVLDTPKVVSSQTVSVNGGPDKFDVQIVDARGNSVPLTRSVVDAEGISLPQLSHGSARELRVEYNCADNASVDIVSGEYLHAKLSMFDDHESISRQENPALANVLRLEDGFRSGERAENESPVGVSGGTDTVVVVKHARKIFVDGIESPDIHGDLAVAVDDVGLSVSGASSGLSIFARGDEKTIDAKGNTYDGLKVGGARGDYKIGDKTGILVGEDVRLTGRARTEWLALQGGQIVMYVTGRAHQVELNLGGHSKGLVKSDWEELSWDGQLAVVGTLVGLGSAFLNLCLWLFARRVRPAPE